MEIVRGQIVSRVESTLLGIRGVIGVLQLVDVDLRRILDLEKNVEEKGLSDITVLNAGVREVFTRKIVFAIGKTTEFPTPSFPTVLLLSNGEIVGEEVVDSATVDLLKSCPEVVFVSERFVIYRNRLRQSARDSLFVLPALPFPALQKIDGVDEVVAASPTSFSDLYVKKKAGWSTSDARLGTLVIGLNLVKSEN